MEAALLPCGKVAWPAYQLPGERSFKSFYGACCYGKCPKKGLQRNSPFDAAAASLEADRPPDPPRSLSVDGGLPDGCAARPDGWPPPCAPRAGAGSTAFSSAYALPMPTPGLSWCGSSGTMLSVERPAAACASS